MVIFNRKERRIKKFTQKVKRAGASKHKFAVVMNEFNAGKLYHSSGYKVKNPVQARAIARSLAYGSSRVKRIRSVKTKQKHGFLRKIKMFLSRRKES